jgi:hypothetical protein
MKFPQMVHGDDQEMIKCSTWKRRKRKTKSNGDQDKGIAYGFGFGYQDTIEGVIIFRIDSRTIKRGILWLNGLLSATR